MGDLAEPKAQSFATAVRNVLVSESFIEKAILFCLTVLITGIAIPLVLALLNNYEATRAKNLNELKARHETLLSAQSRLLDDFTENLILYETLALDVSYFGLARTHNPDFQEKAFARYNNEVITVLTRWNAHIVKARILASPEIAGKMEKMRARVQEQDVAIVGLYNRKASAADWNAQHDASGVIGADGLNLLTELANDLGLSRAAVGLVSSGR